MEQVNGAVLAPAAVMVEMGAAAAGALTDGEPAAMLLTGMSISAPLVLTRMGAPVWATVGASYAGTAEVLSGANRVHCSARVTAVPLQPTGSPMSSP